MAPLDADRHRRELLDRRERDVAARETELTGHRPWRALLWRMRLAPLRVVEFLIGTWLVVSAMITGSGLMAVSALMCGTVIVAAALIRLVE
jgi:hypothetical protein